MDRPARGGLRPAVERVGGESLARRGWESGGMADGVGRCELNSVDP